jgi:hypothetical protein
MGKDYIELKIKFDYNDTVLKRAVFKNETIIVESEERVRELIKHGKGDIIYIKKQDGVGKKTIQNC